MPNKLNVDKTYTVDGYEIEISTKKSMEFLKTNWLELQSNNHVPFFLTWQWIFTWIKTYNPDLILISAKFQKKVVAIGLFTESIETRHGIIRSHQLRLHQMGNILMDQIWMEYNDFIGDDDHLVNAVNASLKALQKSAIKYDEIIFSMILESRARQVFSGRKSIKLGPSQPSFLVNLNEIKDSGIDYIKSLSSNTRYQIKKSIRLYENKYGNLKIHKAESPEEALTYFHQAGKYHIQRWDDSGFKNRLFIQFHENLIRESFEINYIDLLKISSGRKTIAIIYNLKYEGTVYFYLQGIAFEDDKYCKPGLVAHSMVTQLYIDTGLSFYNYMGGYTQQKKQLANPDENLVTLTVWRPRIKFLIETLARKIKRYIK